MPLGVPVNLLEGRLGAIGLVTSCCAQGRLLSVQAFSGPPAVPVDLFEVG